MAAREQGLGGEIRPAEGSLGQGQAQEKRPAEDRTPQAEAATEGRVPNGEGLVHQPGNETHGKRNRGRQGAGPRFGEKAGEPPHRFGQIPRIGGSGQKLTRDENHEQA